MNILLTDLNSLTLDLPEFPQLPPEADDSFTRLLQQELASDFEDGGQAAEFTGFFMDLPVMQEVPPGAPKAAIEAWQDYLSRQQIRVTTSAEATPLMPLQSAAETRTLLLQGDADALAAGAGLPNSGNPLPPAESPAEDIVLQPAEPVLPRVEDTLALVGSSGAANLSVAAVAPQPVDAAEPSAAVAEIRGVTSVTAPPADFDRISPANPVQPLPARVASMQQTSAGEVETAADVIEQAAPLQTRVGDVPPRATLPETIAAPATTVEPAAAASRASVPAPISNSAALAIDNALPLAGQSIAKAEFQAIESNHARVPPAPRGAVAVDAARFGESLEIPNSVQQPVKPAVELAAGGNEQFVRAAEVTVGTGGSQSQPAPVIPAAVHPAAVVNSNSPAAATPAPLPGHLDSMMLARNAEPAAWGEGLGERVSWMVNQKQNNAVIRLDPPLLGKLDVQVRLADDATTITIHTQHAQTRDLIDTASARLRDYLQESGFQNVNVDVSQHQDRQQALAQGAHSEQAGEDREMMVAEDAEGSQGKHAVYSIGDGLLDTFA